MFPGSRLTNPAGGIEYDRHLNTPSMVQEIEALWKKLNATEDEDEQRALEEDVTGKILWFCWRGICAEVEELLPKVVDYIGSLREPRHYMNLGGLWIHSWQTQVMTI
ncbi:hypothetical protein BKA82DRAFT_4162036 [Pisolithus tinctorius]|nr:hypothetical protein BKA82DRAFT_4162036 [Pisolithus tinctorius]